jgi:Cu-processing system permease protein
MDNSALMGYTGAVFKDFFGTSVGITVTTIVLCFWILIPVWISARKFGKKDL